MKIGIIVCAVLIAIMAIIVPATAGGPSQPGFNLWVRGLPGWETATSCNLQAIINPPFFANGEGNNAFVYPAHSDQFTVAYWRLDSQKLAIQTLATPYPSGDFQWEGFVEVGANDTRATQTFDWWVDNSSPDLTWYVQMYRRDTHRLVFRQTIEPGGNNNWGTINSTTSLSGYDLLVASWDANPAPVPEPNSLMALGALLPGMLLFRRRK